MKVVRYFGKNIKSTIMKRLSLLVLASLMLFVGCTDDEGTLIDALEFVASIDVENESIGEEAGSITFNVFIDQENTTGIDISIPYNLTGTATQGEDYDELNGVLTIPNGSRSISQTITIIDDEEEEETETIVISMVTVAGLTFSDGSITISITDNDSLDGD